MQFYEEKKLYEIDTFVLNISVIGIILSHKSIFSIEEQVAFAAGGTRVNIVTEE